MINEYSIISYCIWVTGLNGFGEILLIPKLLNNRGILIFKLFQSVSSPPQTPEQSNPAIQFA